MLTIATWNVENLFTPAADAGPSSAEAYEQKLAALAATQLLYGPGGSQIGSLGEQREDQGDAWRLWNLAPKIPEETRWSRVYEGKGELIDHLLVSKALLDVVGEVRSVVDHGSGGETLRSVNDEPLERRDTPDSDHAPVVAGFGV